MRPLLTAFVVLTAALAITNPAWAESSNTDGLGLASPQSALTVTAGSSARRTMSARKVGQATAVKRKQLIVRNEKQIPGQSQLKATTAVKRKALVVQNQQQIRGQRSATLPKRTGAVGTSRQAVLHKTGRIGREDHAPIPRASSGEHRVVIQVTQNDPAVMNMALNNAQNLRKYYAEQGKSVQIEFVAYGPGLQMLREDISPVKDRIESFGKLANVTFSACGNTMSAQSRSENNDITLISNARVVPAGIARIVELQEQGWSHVRP